MPTGLPMTEDGSTLRFDQQAGVTCLQGKCTTFVPDCGKPCASGTTCFTCISHNANFAACTTMCTDSSQCSDPSLPLCQIGHLRKRLRQVLHGREHHVRHEVTPVG